MACSRAATAGENVLPVFFQPGEERGIAEQAVFGDLGIAGAEFALRQRVEQRGVGDHHHRLMEGADQILAVARIDAGLAADRTVDLRQQRGRHLHIIEPAPHRCRGKAGEIADDAAAERDHKIAALDARRDDRLAYGLERRVALGALADRHHDARGLDAGRFQRGFGGGEMMAGDGLVGDERHARAAAQRLDARAEAGEQAAADDDVIGARTERDLHHRRLTRTQRRGHDAVSAPRCLGISAMISSTMVSCGSSRDCTVMSDNA